MKDPWGDPGNRGGTAHRVVRWGHPPMVAQDSAGASGNQARNGTLAHSPGVSARGGDGGLSFPAAAAGRNSAGWPSATQRTPPLARPEGGEGANARGGQGSGEGSLLRMRSTSPVARPGLNATQDQGAISTGTGAQGPSHSPTPSRTWRAPLAQGRDKAPPDQVQSSGSRRRGRRLSHGQRRMRWSTTGRNGTQLPSLGPTGKDLTTQGTGPPRTWWWLCVCGSILEIFRNLLVENLQRVRVTRVAGPWALRYAPWIQGEPAAPLPSTLSSSCAASECRRVRPGSGPVARMGGRQRAGWSRAITDESERKSPNGMVGGDKKFLGSEGLIHGRPASFRSRVNSKEEKDQSRAGMLWQTLPDLLAKTIARLSKLSLACLTCCVLAPMLYSNM